MAYNLQNYLNTIKPKKTGYNLGGNLNQGIVGRVNRGIFGQSRPQQPVQQIGPVRPANVGATNPASQPIKPPTSAPTTSPVQPTTRPTLPPAANDYISSISSTKAPTASPMAPQPVAQKPETPQNAYLKYLTGMFDPKNLDTARSAQESALKRLADIQSQNERASLDARKGYEAQLDRSGGTREGAQQSAQVYARRASDDIADLALQEAAAARTAQVASDTYEQYINAGKSVFEAETAAASAAQEQANKDRTFEEDKRQFGLQYALAQQKAAETGSESPKEQEKKAASDQFYNVLKQYSDFLGSNTATGIGLSAQKKAMKNNLVAQITALYKQKYALGTLDAGVQKLVEGLLGSGGLSKLSNKAQKSAIDNFMTSLPQAGTGALELPSGEAETYEVGGVTYVLGADGKYYPQ